MAGIRQISVFLSNQSGRLAEVTKLLADNDIDIIALSIADTAQYGALRIITNDNDKAIEVLKSGNFVTKINHVLGIEIPNEPGALSKVLLAFDQNGISVEYIYAFVGKSGKNARVIIRVDDNAHGTDVLRSIGIGLITEEDILKK